MVKNALKTLNKNKAFLIFCTHAFIKIDFDLIIKSVIEILLNL